MKENMNNTTKREVITAGCMVAGQVRRMLLLEGIPFIEDKRLLKTYFFISKEDAKRIKIAPSPK